MIKIVLKYVVTEDGLSIKQILRSKLHISNRLLIKLKLNNKILCNGEIAYVGSNVNKNDIIEAVIDFDENDDIMPVPMDLNIIYEDDYIIAIDKPAGIVVHPTKLHPNYTIANGLKYYLNNKKKIRPINRLDKDTSGIVLFAKNQYIQEIIGVYLDVKKEYIAIVSGVPNNMSGIIDAPIARKHESIIERCVSSDGQNAITEYEILDTIENNSVLKLILKTGRTHQIRVHMAYIGHPILGDTLYGNPSELINRQALHAHKIEFIHPITNKKTIIISKLPEDMSKIIGKKVIET